MQKRIDTSHSGGYRAMQPLSPQEEFERPKRQRSFGEMWSLFLLKVRIKRRYYFLMCLVLLSIFLLLTSEAFFDNVIYVSVIWWHRLENFYEDMPWQFLPLFSAYHRFSMSEKLTAQSVIHSGLEGFCTIHEEIPLLVNMRVPKTAGTTVTNLLLELSPLNYFIVSESSRLHFKSKEEIDNREKDLAFYLTSFQHKTAESGHIRFLDFRKHGHPEPLYIGTFRHPVERMLSHYNYDSFADRPFYVDYKLWVKGQVGVVKPTLTQCVRKFIGMKIFPSDIPYGSDGDVPDAKIRERLKLIPKEYTCMHKKYINVQLKYYCGYHRNCKSLETSSKMLQVAVDNLPKFHVIMLTHKMHQSVHLLEKMLPSFFRGASHIYENYENDLNDAGTAEALALDNLVRPNPYVCGGSVVKGSKRRYCTCNGTMYYGRRYAEEGPGQNEEQSLTLEEMKQLKYVTADVRKMGGMYCTHKHRAFQGGFAFDPAPKLPKQCICEPMPSSNEEQSRMFGMFHMRSNENTVVQSRIDLVPDDVKDYLEKFLEYEMLLLDEVEKHFRNNIERCAV